MVSSVSLHSANALLCKHSEDTFRNSGCAVDFGVGVLVYICAHKNSNLVFSFDGANTATSPVLAFCRHSTNTS